MIKYLHVCKFRNIKVDTLGQFDWMGLKPKKAFHFQI